MKIEEFKSLIIVEDLFEDKRIGRYEDPLNANIKPNDEGTIFVEKPGEKIKWVLFMCPCGCGESVSIPCEGVQGMNGWTSELHEDGTLSLSPSILRSGANCKSHFFLKYNKIIWA